MVLIAGKDVWKQTSHRDRMEGHWNGSYMVFPIDTKTDEPFYLVLRLGK